MTQRIWNKDPSDRILEWKRFRESLSGILPTAMLQTEELWLQSKPYVPYWLDPDIKTWPNTWDLVISTKFCDLSRTLGMFYTLYLSEHQRNNVFQIVVGDCNNRAYNLLYVNDLCLGFQDGKIVKIEDTKEVNITYRYDQNKLEKLFK